MKKLLCLLTFLFLTNNVLASSTSIDNLGESLSYKDISNNLARIEKMTKSSDPDIDGLVAEIPYLNETSIKILNARRNIDDEVKLIEKRLEALGEVDENLPETKIISQKRKEFNNELANERTRISEIDILSAKIDELNTRIFDIRNQMLWGNMLNAEWIFINPAELLKVNHELFVLSLDIIKSPYQWYNSLNLKQKSVVEDNFILVLVAAIMISLLAYGLRRLILTNWGYRKDIDSPRLSRKIVAALTVWCAYGVIPTAVIGFCLYWVATGEVINKSFLGLLTASALYYLLFIIIGRASFRVVFTPYNEKWRLIHMTTYKARKIIKAIYFTIAMVGFFSFLQHIVVKANYSLELLSYVLAIASSIKAICVVWITHLYFQPEVSINNTNDEEDDEQKEAEESNTLKIGLLISLFALSIIILSLFGYARLASFIINKSILSAIVIAAFGILKRLIYDFVQLLLFMGLWVKTFKMRRMFLRKLDFWFGLIAEPVLLVLLGGILLILWGVPSDILQSIIYKAMAGFTIGGIKISLVSILWGIITFVICLWIIRFLRYRIEFKLLEKSNIDAGTKHSLASGFAYIGYILAGLLSIAIMGGNLTNIALIAGALSVGIGLGLQDVVNNFVSGLIMLFERPIKVGDWVVIGTEEGEVKQINIRSTEVQTFNRASVIIPNSQVLSNSVTNKTHQNNWARYAIKVGVAYGSDVERVREILLESALSHPKVAKKPAPYVLFQDFGDNSLVFELRFYVPNINVGWIAPSDVRFIINKRFKEEGIEIPFRQMVIHQGSSVANRTETQFYAKKQEVKDAD